MSKARYIAKHLLDGYTRLYKEKRTREFTIQGASEILNIKSNYVYNILSELAKSGWIIRKFDVKDARKRRYQLKDPRKIIMEIVGVA